MRAIKAITYGSGVAAFVWFYATGANLLPALVSAVFSAVLVSMAVALALLVCALAWGAWIDLTSH